MSKNGKPVSQKFCGNKFFRLLFDGYKERVMLSKVETRCHEVERSRWMVFSVSPL